MGSRIGYMKEESCDETFRDKHNYVCICELPKNHEKPHSGRIAEPFYPEMFRENF